MDFFWIQTLPWFDICNKMFFLLNSSLTITDEVLIIQNHITWLVTSYEATGAETLKS